MCLEFDTWTLPLRVWFLFFPLLVSHHCEPIVSIPSHNLRVPESLFYHYDQVHATLEIMETGTSHSPQRAACTPACNNRDSDRSDQQWPEVALNSDTQLGSCYRLFLHRDSTGFLLTWSTQNITSGEEHEAQSVHPSQIPTSANPSSFCLWLFYIFIYLFVK